LTSASNVHVQVDGEYMGALPAEIVSLPDAIRVVLPRK
jgi:diacylglycerol kinase family enzyme